MSDFDEWPDPRELPDSNGPSPVFFNVSAAAAAINRDQAAPPSLSLIAPAVLARAGVAPPSPPNEASRLPNAAVIPPAQAEAPSAVRGGNSNADVDAGDKVEGSGSGAEAEGSANGGRSSPLGKVFPGPAGVMHERMVPYLMVVFQLMQSVSPHKEAGPRNRANAAGWKQIFDIFFHPVTGQGRLFKRWTGPEGWKKFRKSCTAAVKKYSDRFAEKQIQGVQQSAMEGIADKLQRQTDEAI